MKITCIPQDKTASPVVTPALRRDRKPRTPVPGIGVRAPPPALGSRAKGLKLGVVVPDLNQLRNHVGDWLRRVDFMGTRGA